MRIVPVCRRPTWHGQGLGLAAAAARRGEGPALPARRSRRGPGPGPGPEAERRGAERGRAADSARPGGCPRSAPRGCPAAFRSAPPAAARGPLSGASPPRLRALRSGRPGSPGPSALLGAAARPVQERSPAERFPHPGISAATLLTEDALPRRVRAARAWQLHGESRSALPHS